MSLISFRHSGEKTGFFQKITYLSIISFFSLSILLVCYFVLDPVGFRRSVFQPVRAVIFSQKELEVIPNWNKIEKVKIPSGEKTFITSKSADHLRIAGELRTPKGKGKAPVMLLLHGSSPWGRKEGLIQYLAFRLYKDGWITFAPDARGFGETDNPKEISKPKAWNVEMDVKTCLEYLMSLSRTDRKRIYVFGHSMGAGHALVGALNDKRARALILVGPPRYIDGARITFWNRVRFSAERDLEKPVLAKVVKTNNQVLDVSSYIGDILSRKGHKPILLIDGEKEGEKNLDFLGQKASQIKPPLKYQTLSGTGHYCGTYNLFGSSTIYVRLDMFDPFYNLLTSYINEIKKST